MIDELMEKIAGQKAELARLRAELEREKVDALNYADQMERLRAANEELVEALKKIARGVDCPEGIIKRPDFYASQDYFEHIAIDAISRAEQAEPETCVWNDNNKQTECGGGAIPHRELLAQMDSMTFCPFCGKQIERAGKAEGR